MTKHYHKELYHITRLPFPLSYTPPHKAGEGDGEPALAGQQGKLTRGYAAIGAVGGDTRDL